MTQFWDCTKSDMVHLPVARLIPESPLFAANGRGTTVINEAAASGAPMVVVDIEHQDYDSPAVQAAVFGYANMLRRKCRPGTILCLYPGWKRMATVELETAAEFDVVGVPAYFDADTPLGNWDRLLAVRSSVAALLERPLAAFVCDRRGPNGGGPRLALDEWRHAIRGASEFPHVAWWGKVPPTPEYIAEFGVIGGT